jgi:glycosyltransferase involved in cell wall biosynthesis
MNNKPENTQNASDRLNLVWICSETMEILHSTTKLETTKELRKLGWEVTLITAGQYGCRTIRGIKFFQIPRPNIYIIRQIFFHLGVIWYLRKKYRSIDVMLFHSMSTPWILPLKIMRIFRAQKRPYFVMDTRTLPMAPEDKKTQKDKVRYLFNSITNKIANHWADGRTVITKHIAKSLDIPNEKLWGIWPSGVQLEYFVEAKEKRAWPQQEEPIHLIYIGCMHYERNLMNLSKAVVKANKNGHKFSFTMVGDGNERHDLEEYAQKSAKHIQVIPSVPFEQIPTWLSQAHVGVLPFPDEEKFRVSSPIKLFEYMASGLPILATRIVCHTDIVGPNDFIFWADGSDAQSLYHALEKAHQNRNNFPLMGQKAANEAQKWTWKASAVKLDTALRQGIKRLRYE